MLDQSQLETGYVYDNAEQTGAHRVLLPMLDSLLKRYAIQGTRMLDLGCGNGSVTSYLASKGYEVSGIDASSQGIEQARKAYPALRFLQASAYDPLSETLGLFDVIVSLEVVEHIFAPRVYMQRISELLNPGGTLIISTPYHSYLKNLALALTGKMDEHFTALWDNGHIKFWSRKTLTTLLHEQGLEVIAFERVGRIKPLAMSMMLVARAI
jgi:2-polyprenyl-3-methyl-5-hydroxy-6-metoxy-1,4-benzoquinol methylase